MGNDYVGLCPAGGGSVGNDYVGLCPAGGGSVRAHVHFTVSASMSAFVAAEVVVADRFHTIQFK